MKQELLESIKKDYEDYLKMVESNFKELDDEFITPGRLKRVEKIREKHSYWITSEDVDIYDYILDEAIDNNLVDNEIGNTNKVLMYIAELTYNTYNKLFKKELELPKMNPEYTYVLYMDIEDNSKYFIPKEYQKEFEESHNVIVTYKNPNCNAGWNFDRNIEGIKEVRREFIKQAMHEEQEEVAKEFIKKYQG